MMKSKYFHYIKIQDDIYAVFNSLILEIEYISNNDFTLLNKNNIISAISLDGPKNINDKNRIFKGGNKSVYDSVMNAIKILKENDYKFGLSITLSKEVVNEGQKIVKWLKDLDVKDIYFNPLHYNESNDEWEEHYESQQNL